MSRNTKWLVAFFGLMITTAAMALTVNGELKKALFEKLSADPTGYTARVYYNTTSNKTRIYDGTSWSDIGGATSSLDEFLIDVGSAANARTTVNTNLLGDAAVSSVSATATITIASPGVVTITGHGLTTGKKIYFTTTGALPTGLSASTTYYVIFVDANTFRLATTMANAFAGTAINTSGSQSGVHTGFYGGIHLASSITGAKTFNDQILVGRSGQAIPFWAYRDTNAGDSTNIMSAAFGNSGLNQGQLFIQYVNAAATASPSAILSFQPRNNANTTNINPGNITFTKDSGADTGKIDISANKALIQGYQFASYWTAPGSDCTASPCSEGSDPNGMLDDTNRVTRSSTGTYTMNFTTSYWSSGPNCIVSPSRGGAKFCLLNTSGASTTSYAFSCYNDGGSLTDTSFVIMCHGAR